MILSDTTLTQLTCLSVTRSTLPSAYLSRLVVHTIEMTGIRILLMKNIVSLKFMTNCQKQPTHKAEVMFFVVD
uniref:Uncharacterized protein n=1 Tax=Anguilla anguilla TaxID=7936 RepID=A0A0E9X3T7_ANGAN